MVSMRLILFHIRYLADSISLFVKYFHGNPNIHTVYSNHSGAKLYPSYVMLCFGIWFGPVNCENRNQQSVSIKSVFCYLFFLFCYFFILLFCTVALDHSQLNTQKDVTFLPSDWEKWSWLKQFSSNKKRFYFTCSKTMQSQCHRWIFCQKNWFFPR